MERREGGPAAAARGSLLERERELAAIDAALAAACAGAGELLFVEAQAGLGKSCLIRAACDQAASNAMTVLTARGSELEREHAFGVVLQLFQPVLRHPDADLRQAVLAGAARLARPLLEGNVGLAATPDEQLFASLHGLYWLTSNLAERAPLLVAVDDLHWTDRPSLRFLAYLAQRVGDLPVAVVASARPAEPGAAQDLLQALKSHMRATTARPAPLSAAGVACIVRERMPGADDEFATACAAVTAGNPYLLCELVADALDRGLPPTAAGAAEIRDVAPDAVLQAALGRLIRLPSAATPLAHAVAVLGADARLRHVAELAGLDRGTAAAMADALGAAEILAPLEPLRFVHPLLHSAVYADLPRATRGDAHARAARIVDRAREPIEAVAAHLLAADGAGDTWVVERLRAAAERSLSQGAADSAVLYLERALAEPPPPEMRADVMLALGRAEALGGKAGAVSRLEQALDLIDDPRRRAEVLREIGWTAQKSGDLHGAVRAFERGLAELRGTDDDEATTALLVTALQVAHLGVALLDSDDADAARARVDHLLEATDGPLGVGERGVLSVVAVQSLFRGDPADDAIALCRRVWGDGALLADEGHDSPTLWHVVGCLSWSDALDESETIIEAALEQARREGSIVTLALALYARSWPRYWRGDVAGSAADSQSAVAAWSGEFSMYLPVAAFWLALALLEVSDVDGAAAAVDYPDAEERWGDTNMYGPLLAGQGAVALARGRAAEAAERFGRVADSVFGSFVRNPAVLPWRSYLSAAELALGNDDAGRQAAAEEVEIARRFGAARPLGIALRAAGLAERGARGVDLLTESVATLRTSPARLELIRALVDLGRELRRQGSRAAARDPLREALALAQRLGAAALERRALDELLASGAKPRRREAVGVAALTPSERRVAELAAEGMTNREIAQSLFVTAKAVQFHLRNVYRKLEIASRHDLAAALER